MAKEHDASNTHIQINRWECVDVRCNGRLRQTRLEVQSSKSDKGPVQTEQTARAKTLGYEITRIATNIKKSVTDNKNAEREKRMSDT